MPTEIMIFPSSHLSDDPNLSIRLQLLQLLSGNPRLSQRELSREMGVALGKINYCLNALVTKGSIKLENFRGANNRMRYAYMLTPSGLEEKARLTLRFLKHRLREYHDIKAEIQHLCQELEQADPELLTDPALRRGLKKIT